MNGIIRRVHAAKTGSDSNKIYLDLFRKIGGHYAYGSEGLRFESLRGHLIMSHLCDFIPKWFFIYPTIYPTNFHFSAHIRPAFCKVNSAG